MITNITNIESRIFRGCCGRGAAQKTKNQAFAKSLTAGVEIAANGFTELEYSGLRSAGEKFTVYGYYTGTMYRVTPSKTFMADNQDLSSGNTSRPGLLEMLEGNRQMFRVVKQTETETTKPVRLVEETVIEKTLGQQTPDSKPYQVGVDDSSVDTRVRESFKEDYFTEEFTEPDPDDVVDLFTALDGNLSHLDFALNKGTISKQGLEYMIAYEMANQNRKGAFERIEAAIEKLKGEDD